jgi:transcriptional regulator with XRE-family HTH domain
MVDQAVIIGERLRALREEKKLSQGDLEKKTGLLRCYASRGVISMLAIKIPEPKTEDFYVASVNQTVDAYAQVLGRMRNAQEGQEVDLALQNLDLDTGKPVRPGTYRLTDETYAQLLDRLTFRPERPIPAEVRQDVLDFYANPDSPNSTKKNAAEWQRVQSQLATLKAMKTPETGSVTQ